MRDADFTQFRAWYDRTCLLPTIGVKDTANTAAAFSPNEARDERLAA